MIHDYLYSARQQRKTLIALLAGVLLMVGGSVISVQAANEAPVNDKPGGISIRVERRPIENSTTGKHPEDNSSGPDIQDRQRNNDKTDEQHIAPHQPTTVGDTQPPHEQN